MHKIKSLEDYQQLLQWFQTQISKSESIDQSLTSSQETDVYLNSSPRLDSKQRLDIYIKDYWTRCLESLTEDFPGLQLILGETAFKKLLHHYLQQFPSESYTLRHLGKNLIQYLTHHYEGPHQNLLMDMARLEWAHMEIFEKKIFTPFNPQTLNDQQKSQLAQQPLSLQPHVQLLHLHHSVHRLLKSSHPPEKLPEIQETWVIVYKEGGSPQTMEIDQLFYTLLKAFQENNSLEQTIQELSNRLSLPEQEALQLNLQNWLQDCISHGWLYQP